MQALASSHELGSHTWSHVNAKKCDAKVLRKELLESKRYLEKITGRPVYGMAYPWGAYSPKSAGIVHECGLLFGRTTKEGNLMFPPKDSYTWGVSIYAKGATTTQERLHTKREQTWRRLLSRKPILYARYRTGDWRRLALKLFEKARRVNGVWHLYGHSSDFPDAGPEAEQQLLEVSRHVALKADVWYATNGMLFLNEIVKKATSITSSRVGPEHVFRIRTSIPKNVSNTTPIPLILSAPSEWGEKFRVEVTTTNAGKVEIRRVSKTVWIDIFDREGTLRVTPQ